MDINQPQFIVQLTQNGCEYVVHKVSHTVKEKWKQRTGKNQTNFMRNVIVSTVQATKIKYRDQYKTKALIDELMHSIETSFYEKELKLNYARIYQQNQQLKNELRRTKQINYIHENNYNDKTDIKRILRNKHHKKNPKYTFIL